MYLKHDTKLVIRLQYIYDVTLLTRGFILLTKLIFVLKWKFLVMTLVVNLIAYVHRIN